MKTLEEIMSYYNVELNEANEVILIREYNLEEEAFQNVENMNALAEVSISVCTYPEERNEYEEEVFVADFFFNIDKLNNQQVIDTIEILLNYS